jgi:hypothetical protein
MARQPYRYERAERRYGYDWSPSLADDLFGRRRD